MSATSPRAAELWLLAATLAVAVAGLIYELIAATVSSYLLGDSIRQFSFVIGVFLSAMGLGAWLSRFVSDATVGFVRAQIVLGVVGGAAGAVVFLSYAASGIVGLPLYGALILVGVLSGMEIPLLARILEQIGAARFRFENVLTVDYLGALIASLSFPILIIPHLSLVAAGLAFGVLNLVVAGGTLWLFRAQFGRATWVAWGLCLGGMVVALIMARPLVSAIDARLYEDEIIYSERSAYQQILVTRHQDRVRLFLDGSIQFDSRDEHRYHEALVHPAMASATQRARVLVLGGGDGMAVREVLRWSEVEAVTLVDLDPAVTRLFRDHRALSALNAEAFKDPRVTVINADAFAWAQGDAQGFDVIIADLPDPRNHALSKLYSLEFMLLLKEKLHLGGSFVTQAGSPMFAPEAFSIVAATVGATPDANRPEISWSVTPYHSYVPSFGMWGFVLGHPQARTAPLAPLPEGLRYFSPQTWSLLQRFDPETAPQDASPNRLQSHDLVRAYEAGWAEWFR